MTDSSKNNSKKNPKTNEAAEQYAEELKNMNDFRAGKHVSGAVTWFVCLLLISACFYETRIVSMALMIPILIVLAVGFYREGKHSQVKFDGNRITLSDFHSFRRMDKTLDIGDISRVLLDVSTEGKNEIIHSVILETGGKTVTVPDVDFKEALVDKLTSMNSKIKVKKL